MQDAVAEVLVDRRNGSVATGAGVLVSAILHIGAAALFVIVARNASVSPQRVVTIRLAPARGGFSAPAGTPAAPKRVAPHTPPATKSVAEVKPEVVPAKTPAKGQKPTDKSLYGKAAPVKAVAPPKPSGGSAGTGGASQSAAVAGIPGGGQLPAVGTAGITGLEGGDFPFSTYLTRMTTLIGGHWFRPQVRGEMIVVIRFSIQRDGSLRDIEIESSSGNSAFDRAALRAVMESSPLPPLPFAYEGTFLGVHLTFH